MGPLASHARCHMRAADDNRWNIDPPVVTYEGAMIQRWLRKRANQNLCHRLVGHCYHVLVDPVLAWRCCGCSREIEGIPPEKCKMCLLDDREAIR